MRYLGSQPGGLLFRAVVTALLILILVVQFFRYVEDVERETEIASVEQTVRIVNSSLLVYFSKLAINQRLNDIGELEGRNPFPLLEPYGLLPAEYDGEVETISDAELESGWFYVKDVGEVIYRYRYQDKLDRYRLSLKFDDRDENSLFEHEVDRVYALHLSLIS